MPSRPISADRVERLTLAIRDLYVRRLAARQAREYELMERDLLRDMRQDVRMRDFRRWFPSDAPELRYLAARMGYSFAEHDRWEGWSTELVERGLRAGSPEWKEALRELMRAAEMLPADG